jgi:hypothetical protein
MAQPADPRYEMAYQEAIRAVTQQQGVLEDLRARAGTLIAAAAVATSFFGADAFGGSQQPGGFGWLAVALFVASSLASLAILVPWRNWMFATYPSVLIESWFEIENAPSITEIYRQRALFLESDYEANRKRLTKLTTAMYIAVGALILEIVCWLLELGRG